MKTAVGGIFLILLFLYSCFGEYFVPDLEGSLVGYVRTFDEFAVKLPDHSGVLIAARGLRIYKTLSDNAGRFEFFNLSAGTYELVFYKPGFGVLKQFNIRHLGGAPTILGQDPYYEGSFTPFYLYQLPETEIVQLKIENDTIYARFKFKESVPEKMWLYIFFSDKKGFNTNQSIQTKWISLKKGLEIFKGKVGSSSLGFNKGQEVFFRACILNRASNGIDTYVDYATNKTIYPNLGNESEEFSFIMQ